MSLLVYVLNFLVLLGLVWWMRRQNWVEELKPYFYPALLLKLVCGLLLGILYTYHYQGGDTITYHNASLILTGYAKLNPGGYAKLLFFNTFESEELKSSLPFTQYADFSNSFYFIKLLSLLNLLTYSSYYIKAFYLSLFSFLGAARLAAVLMEITTKASKAGIVSFLFFPSVVFWSSGLSKDALMFGSMTWVIAAAFSFAHGHRFSFWQIILLPVLLYVFVKTRLFFAAVVLPLLLLYFIIKRTAVVLPVLRRPSMQIGTYILAFTSGLLIIAFLQQFLPLGFLLEQSAHNYYSLLERSLHGPHVVLENLEPTFTSMVSNLPEALVSAVYRPLIGESWERLYILMGLENLLLLLFTVMALASFSKKFSVKVELVHLLFMLIVLTLGGIVGLTTPNFGSLSRYRIVFLPFLVYLLLQNKYAQRLIQRVGL